MHIHMDARVQDYLDDKLQSSADLESLDSLLAAVQEQQHLLKQQVFPTFHCSPSSSTCEDTC